jgi:hypothetical protein
MNYTDTKKDCINVCLGIDTIFFMSFSDVFLFFLHVSQPAQDIVQIGNHHQQD